MARRYRSEKERTRRAYAAHFLLVETSEWWRTQLKRHYEEFNLTWMEYRVLEELYKTGGQHQQEIGRRFDCSKQNIRWVIRRLASRNWLQFKETRLQAGNVADSRRIMGHWIKTRRSMFDPIESRAKVPKGRRIVHVSLTEDGRRKFSYMIWMFAKYIKSLMRVLDGREQMTLCRLLLKLRQGDVLKFHREMTRWNWAEVGVSIEMEKAGMI